jgi:hypothetical protein
MSSRPILQPAHVISDGDMSGSITSDITIITNLTVMSYSYIWSGASPLGEIVIEVSDDYSQNVAGGVNNAGTWTALTLSDTTLVSGNTGSGYVDLSQVGAYAIRTRYVRTSGTGTLQAYFKGKVS